MSDHIPHNSLLEDYLESLDHFEFKHPCIQKEEIFINEGSFAISTRKLDSLKKIAMLQRYYQCNPVQFINDFFNIELFDAQKLLVQRAWTTPNVMVVATRGFGKALALDTRIPTPDGDKTMNDIQPGDYVFNEKGEPVKVTSVSPVWEDQPTYIVSFSDGEEITCSGNHEWMVSPVGRYSKDKMIVDTEYIYNNLREKQTVGRISKIIKSGKKHPKVKFSIDSPSPVQYPKKNLKTDPFLVGSYIFSPSPKKGYAFLYTEKQFARMKIGFEDLGYKLTLYKKDKKGVHCNFADENKVPVDVLLRSDGVFPGGHIPEAFLMSDIQDRISLFQGIMEIFGTGINVPKAGFKTLYGENLSYLDELCRLATSLGIKYTVEQRSPDEHKTKKIIGLKIYWNRCRDMPEFRLVKRKTDSTPLRRDGENRKNTASSLVRRKYITAVDKIPPVPTKCISVEGESHCYLCGERNTITHNSTVIDVVLMAKGMLFCNYWTYIASGSGAQAQQTFMTLEKLANDNIDGMIGSTGYIFKNEVVVPNANGDGFSHSSDGYKYTLYNDSSSVTLNSSVDRKRGLRGNVVFDETGWLSAEMLHTYAAFAVVNKAFKTGKDAQGNSLDPIRLRAIPEEIPNQVFYISSASSTDTEFYRLYRNFSKRMLMGDPNYFVVQLDCEVAFHPTLKGEPIAPLLSKTTVQNAMKANPEKGRREYYCEFTSDAGVDAVVKRGQITKYSETYAPIMRNRDGKSKYWLTYDPARMTDNAVILIGEKFESNGEIKCRIANCINLVDIHKKKRTPVTIPEQVKILRETIQEYNAGGNEFYSNIEGIYIDAGSGGQAAAISDLMMEDWTDSAGITHRGLVDPEYSAEDMRKFPNAIKGKLHMMQPTAYKSLMYEALIQMVSEGHIIFTTEYDNKGYIMVAEDESERRKALEKIANRLENEGLSGTELEEKLSDEVAKLPPQELKTVRLDPDQEAALVNIDLVKDEVVNMVRIKRAGKDGFELTPEKARTMHDDHSYVLAELGYALLQTRTEDRNRKRSVRSVVDIADLLASQTKRVEKKWKMFN